MIPESLPAVPILGKPTLAARPGTGRSLVHQCQVCGERFDHGFTPRCPSCAGLVEVLYDLADVRLYDSHVTSHRYADLLPVRDRANLLFLGEGQTPCLHAQRLGELLGLEQLYLKLEAHNPTGTTKDRMAAIVLSLFNELNIREFISSSTGNSSSALARGILIYPQFTMHLYIGSGFEGRVRYCDSHAGVQLHVMENMSFAEAFSYAKDQSKDRRLPFEAGFFNPARREGLKLAYFEAVEQIPTPIDWCFQAVSSAMGIYGAWKGAKELVALDKTPYVPHMVCVQQDTCCPMVKAYRDGSPQILPRHVVPHPTGIAKAILRGDPTHCYPYVYAMVKETGGTFVSVSEAEIVEAQAQLRAVEGVAGGFCGAATIAALVKLRRQRAIEPSETVLLNLTD